MWAFFVGDFMAIQTINLTVPGGDTPRSANTKINANFSDQDNAASRLVGAGSDQLPTGKDVFAGLGGGVRSYRKHVTSLGTKEEVDVKALPVGEIFHGVSNSTTINAPDAKFGGTPWRVETYQNHPTSNSSNYYYQLAFPDYNGYNRGSPLFRNSGDNDWQLIGQNPVTYNTTTASGANVVVTSSGELQRSTSSERYKDILSPLELDDARYADAMALKPIVYRSTADADNPAYHYYSFSAEELGTYDPAFTLWRDTETVTDADGNVTEQPLAERQAEGININALLAMSHAIAIKQGELIKDLQDQVIEQKEAIAALQQTNP